MSRSRAITLISAVTILMSLSTPALAQILSGRLGTQDGTRVRLSGPALGPSVIGRIVERTDSTVSLDLERGPRATLPWSMVSKIEFGHGTDYLGAGLKGLKYGAYAAPAVTLVALKVNGSEGLDDLGTMVATLTLVPILGGIGGILLAPERWDDAGRPANAEAVSDSAALSRLSVAAGTRLRLRMQSGQRIKTTTAGTGPISLSSAAVSAGVDPRSIALVSVPAGISRTGGAIRGALILLGVTAIGVATDPLPTAIENVGVALSNGAIGAVIGARFFPTRGWMRLLDPRQDH